MLTFWKLIKLCENSNSNSNISWASKSQTKTTIVIGEFNIHNLVVGLTETTLVFFPCLLIFIPYTSKAKTIECLVILSYFFIFLLFHKCTICFLYCFKILVWIDYLIVVCELLVISEIKINNVFKNNLIFFCLFDSTWEPTSSIFFLSISLK